MKKILFLAVCMLSVAVAFAQGAKKIRPPLEKNYDNVDTHLNWPGKSNVPAATNPFGAPEFNPKPLPAYQPVSANNAAVQISRDDNGMPIFFKGKTDASGNSSDLRPMGERALDYVASLNPFGLEKPATEFVVKAIQTDDQNGTHVRLTQVYQGIPVYGGEMIAHAKNGVFEAFNGRYFPTPQVSSVVPALGQDAAIELVKTDIGRDKVKSAWTAEELKLVGGNPYITQLTVYHKNDQMDQEKLVWNIEAHPNMLRRYVYFVDAQTGEILHHYDHTCQIDGGRLVEKHGHMANETVTEEGNGDGEGNFPPPLDGPVTASGLDLLNVSRTFGAWQVNSPSAVILEDAGKSMFNAGGSVMPNDPVGVIVTLNGFNTSPETQAFNFDLVSSANATFTNKTAVSAHWNSSQSFDYYKNTFGRNSIDGVGGNILAFFNVSESDGSSMENAFWNGDAMWYGNGGSTFKPLARGLDVGGHEMTHGVVEKTANLEYQNESGALNESFADIFGSMIDRDDWQIGEDVMQTGVSPNNALRSLEDPHNGDVTNGQWWQPKHVNEKYTGAQDNGGVHINSGIPNHAFYLFANNAAVGKNKAEQVYYKALRDYLVKSSKFVDERLAVIQAANDLYGSTVANAAAAAFDAVGIGGSTPSGNYLGQLAVNPGQDFILCTNNDYSKLELALGDGTVLGSLFNQGVRSRASVRDDGTEFVFVANDGYIMGGVLIYNADGSIDYQTFQLSDEPIWRNAALSKDGRYVAAIKDASENRIYFWDLTEPIPTQQTFFLYNPTYTQGQFTGDVKYADVLEFDYSGKKLMYDSYNQPQNSLGEDISHWDIGFVTFWANGNFTDGGNAPIAKLFNGLPEKTSVADPAFAKNSPFVITFDVFDELNNRYDVLAANVETGDLDLIFGDNGDLGWPSYNRLDNAVLFESEGLLDYNLYIQPVDASKIAASGNVAKLVNSHVWGTWFANGVRNLAVDATEPVSAIQQISLSPNPSVDITRLTFEMPVSADVQIQIVNALGQSLLTQTVQANTGTNSVDLYVQGMPSGTYFVRITSGQAVAVATMIKQ